MEELSGYNKLITIEKINENINRILMNLITQITIKKIK